MSVSLKKGQKISLTKENSSLDRIVIGLGWDQIQKKGGFFSKKPADIDCDASVFMLKEGKLGNKEDVVYFGNLTHKSRSVVHTGDNLTGAGEGDDEQIIVELGKIPSDYDRIVLVVNIYAAQKRKQHFGMIENAFIRVIDAKSNTEMCKYILDENYDNMTAMIFGEVYRNNDEWKFNAIGQATADIDLGELSRRYI